MSDLIFEFLALLLGVSNVIWSEKTLRREALIILPFVMSFAFSSPSRFD